MKPRVLIVDDSLTVRMDLSEAFDAAGMAPSRCADLASARRAVAASPFSLIVLDVLLPDGDGVEFLKELKTAAPDAPVILLSTEAEVQDRVRGLQTGADEYVGKPYDTTYVIARAKELVRSSAAADQSQVRILVIDDSETFRHELKDRLEEAGYSVLMAASGEEGLRSAINERPTAIVVDSRLPGIDGSTVLSRIREDAILRRTPCLLLTGSEDRGEELRALEAGADVFVHKEEGFPVVLARLAAMLRLASAPPVLPSGKSVLGPKKILAIDNSVSYLQELAAQLRQEGYDVAVARSGQEALELLTVESVDCILLGLAMPGLSGQETCRRIKSNPLLRDIPVLLLSGLEERESMVDGLNAGADDFILKSSDFEALRARIRAALRRKQFGDEDRQAREDLLAKELEAADARAQREVAELRAAMLADLESKNEELHRRAAELESANAQLRRVMDERALDQAKLSMALAAGQIGSFECCFEEQSVVWSAEVERIHGLAAGSFRGTPEHWQSLLAPEDAARLWPEFLNYGRAAESAAGVPADYEAEYRTIWPDGGVHWILLKGRRAPGGEGPVRIIGTAQDITERKRSEERLRHRQKLESIGLLAGGVAHDFNNLLAAIMGNASLLQADADYQDRREVGAILEASERAAELTRQLLAYAGKAHVVVQPVAVSETVSKMTELLHSSIPRKVTLRQKLAVDLPTVHADPGQMQQIVMNLVINAAEAIPKDAAGTVEIACYTRAIGHGEVTDEISREPVTPGEYVCLEVKDTGSGMDAATKSKIFEPFFSTKFTGRGLGLAALAGAVKAHSGAVQVMSRPGQGTTFRVFLPASSKAPQSAAERPKMDLQGAGTILVVDDERSIREMVKRSLGRLGYTVLTASDGREAIEVIEENAGEIDLVLLDLTMPVMGGDEALKTLRRKAPKVKMILMSGYGETEARRAFGDQAPVFVQKPFTASSLAAEVKSALAGKSEPARRKSI